MNLEDDILDIDEVHIHPRYFSKIAQAEVALMLLQVVIPIFDLGMLSSVVFGFGQMLLLSRTIRFSISKNWRLIVLIFGVVAWLAYVLGAALLHFPIGKGRELYHVGMLLIIIAYWLELFGQVSWAASKQNRWIHLSSVVAWSFFYLSMFPFLKDYQIPILAIVVLGSGLAFFIGWKGHYKSPDAFLSERAGRNVAMFIFALLGMIVSIIFS